MISNKSLPIEFDAKSVRNDGTFSGYASTFGNVDSYYDMVMPGAFTESLKTKPINDVFMLAEHNYNEVPIGDWLEAVENEKGLFVQGRLDREDPEGERIYNAMKKGRLSKMSIGYRTVDATPTKDGIRQLNKVDLMEISIVKFPANPQATITAVKSPKLNIDILRESLRDLGFTRKTQDTVIHRVKQSLVMDTEGNPPTDAADADREQAHAAELAALMQRLETSLRA